MSTELNVLLGHNLDATRIADLPTLLNQYFAPYLHQIQVRVDHGYTGTIVQAEDDGWDWQGSENDDWELQLAKLEDEDLWNWGWYSEQSDSFENWFQEQQLYGYVHLVGCYGMSLLVGSNSLVLSTGIRWDHFVFDPIVQNDLRQFLRYLAKFFGTNSVIYMPDGTPPACHVADDCVAKGWSFEQILSWLQSQQAPAKFIREMIKTVYVESTKCWSPQGYYVEEIL
ncbi:MAG TPA: hypothetical protein DDW76_29560 [Cyanobacteria bacterium UBA11369]|nr:hypothetical protein [Cyanobacteria bacterium UBA11371]HBE33909.1 hypothetical protein [Cyanobacteria bacterium UBA11368]HBE52794.1 hypothetical protein [Cyanobacteria bacterium UBA11369]